MDGGLFRRWLLPVSATIATILGWAVQYPTEKFSAMINRQIVVQVSVVLPALELECHNLFSR